MTEDKLKIRVHPGRILQDEYLAPLGVSPGALADHVDMIPESITAILSGEKSVGAFTAKLFAAALGTTPQFWLNLQTRYDLASTPDAPESLELIATPPEK